MLRRSRLVVTGVVTTVAGLAIAVAVIQLGDGSTGTRTIDTTRPSTTSSTTDGRPSSTTAPMPGPSTTATTTSPTTQPPPPGRATVVRHGDTAAPLIALTFDAGSDVGATSRILDLLAARHVTASFGLTGRWVEQHPELASRIVTDGHAVINHTLTHPSFTGLSTNAAPLVTDERLTQLRGAEDLIRTVTGSDPRPWFRPPYGDYDDSVLVDVASAGYRYVVMWSIDSLGWKGLPPPDVAARTIAALEPGAIVLMHVGSASTDIDALPAILDAIEQRGLEPVTIADLIGS